MKSTHVSDVAAMVYHASIAATLDLLMPSMKDGRKYSPVEVDQDMAVQFAEFAGRTWTPPQERPDVLAALSRLKDRVTKATLKGDLAAVIKIAGAITAIEQQAEKLPSAGNGDARHGTAAAVQRTVPSRR